MNNLIRDALLNLISRQGCKGLITIFDFIKVDLRESINIKIMVTLVYLITIILISYAFYFEDILTINNKILEVIYESYYLLIAMLVILIFINIFKIISIFSIRRIILDYENIFLIKVTGEDVNDDTCNSVISIFEEMVTKLSTITGVNVYTIFTILNKQIKHTLIKLI